MPRKPKGMVGDFLKKKTKAFIENQQSLERKKRKPKRKVQTRTAKNEAAGRGKTGIIGRASRRRDNKLGSIMGEMRKTRGR